MPLATTISVTQATRGSYPMSLHLTNRAYSDEPKPDSVFQNSLQRIKYDHQDDINKETKIEGDELGCSLTICKQKKRS